MFLKLREYFSFYCNVDDQTNAPGIPGATNAPGVLGATDVPGIPGNVPGKPGGPNSNTAINSETTSKGAVTATIPTQTASGSTIALIILICLIAIGFTIYGVNWVKKHKLKSSTPQTTQQQQTPAVETTGDDTNEVVPTENS